MESPLAEIPNGWLSMDKTEVELFSTAGCLFGLQASKNTNTLIKTINFFIKQPILIVGLILPIRTQLDTFKFIKIPLIEC